MEHVAQTWGIPTFLGQATWILNPRKVDKNDDFDANGRLIHHGRTEAWNKPSRLSRRLAAVEAANWDRPQGKKTIAAARTLTRFNWMT